MKQDAKPVKDCPAHQDRVDDAVDAPRKEIRDPKRSTLDYPEYMKPIRK